MDLLGTWGTLGDDGEYASELYYPGVRKFFYLSISHLPNGLSATLGVTNSNTSGSACSHAPCPGGETQAFPVISEVDAERRGWDPNSVGWRSLSGNHTLCLKEKNKIICILPQRVEHSTKRDIRYRVLGTDTNKMLQDCANGGGEEMRMTDRNYSLK